jgi:hypothetical protein
MHAFSGSACAKPPLSLSETSAALPRLCKTLNEAPESTAALHPPNYRSSALPGVIYADTQNETVERVPPKRRRKSTDMSAEHVLSRSNDFRYHRPNV